MGKAGGRSVARKVSLGLAILGIAGVCGLVARLEAQSPTRDPRQAQSAASRRDGATHWLVTREGEWIAIKGPWQVKGQRVLFTLPNGTLSAIRLSEVDLESSRTASQETKTAPQRVTADKPEKPPVLVLTDKDVGHVEYVAEQDPGDDSAAAEGEGVATGTDADASSESGESAPAEAGSAGGADTTTSTTSPAPLRPEDLEVISYRELDPSEGAGVEVYGTLRNRGNAPARQVSVNVLLYNEDDELVESAPARIANRVLPANETLTFHASFPDIAGYDSIKFEVTSER